MEHYIYEFLATVQDVYHCHSYEVRGGELGGKNYLTTSVDNDVLSLKIAVTVSRELGSESRPLSAAYR